MASATYQYSYVFTPALGSSGRISFLYGQNFRVQEAVGNGILSPLEQVKIDPGGRDASYVGIADDNGSLIFRFNAADYMVLSNRTYQVGDLITYSAVATPLCFLAGTAIATPDGPVAVETLTAGDQVRTADGAAKPVRWLGRQTVSTLFADPVRVLPVRIAAGALGEGLPARDLFVSADHALLLDGVLVQAGALLNGRTITRHAEVPQSFVYYHVELDGHELVLAEGVAAESFIDNGARRRFDNWQEAPDVVFAEMELPRVKSARQLPRDLARRLEARAGEVAWVA